VLGIAERINIITISSAEMQGVRADYGATFKMPAKPLARGSSEDDTHHSIVAQMTGIAVR